MTTSAPMTKLRPYVSLASIAVAVAVLISFAVASAADITIADRPWSSREGEFVESILKEVLRPPIERKYGQLPIGLPQRTLAKRVPIYDLIASFRQRKGMESTRYFLFYRDDYQADSPSMIPVRKADIWGLLRRGDTLMLSDGVTHHISTVFHVDRAKDTIFLADEFPDESFLRPGFNEAGVAAVIVESKGDKLLKLKKTEFLSVAAQVLTFDSPDFVDTFFKQFPRAKDDRQTSLALALSLMGPENYTFLERDS